MSKGLLPDGGGSKVLVETLFSRVRQREVNHLPKSRNTRVVFVLEQELDACAGSPVHHCRDS